jgi:hypothetical protein
MNQRNEETKVIVISRAGAKETSQKYAMNRLEVFKTALHSLNEKSVYAIGAKAKRYPQIEVYINGKLALIFETRNKQQARVGNCNN